MLQRADELSVLERVAPYDIAPAIYGIFANGRFEEYLQASPLQHTFLSHSTHSASIAQVCSLALYGSICSISTAFLWMCHVLLLACSCF